MFHPGNVSSQSCCKSQNMTFKAKRWNIIFQRWQANRHFRKPIAWLLLLMQRRFHGVMVSTLDFESSDPSSSLGGTYLSAAWSSIFSWVESSWLIPRKSRWSREMYPDSVTTGHLLALRMLPQWPKKSRSLKSLQLAGCSHDKKCMSKQRFEADLLHLRSWQCHLFNLSWHRPHKCYHSSCRRWRSGAKYRQLWMPFLCSEAGVPWCNDQHSGLFTKQSRFESGWDFGLVGEERDNARGCSIWKRSILSKVILGIYIAIIQRGNEKLSLNSQMTQPLANSMGMFARTLVALARY